MQIKSIFSLLLRSTLVTLVLRVIRYHTDYEVEACHSTTIYVQNGTWLNTSRWLQNGFFGSEDLLPLTEPTPSLPFTDKSTTVNPVNPLLGFIPNKRQKCLCGTIVSASESVREIETQKWRHTIVLVVCSKSEITEGLPCDYTSQYKTTVESLFRTRGTNKLSKH